MPSILDFFKPVRQDKRRREEDTLAVSTEEASIAVPRPPQPPSDAQQKPRNANDKSTDHDDAEPPAKRQTPKREANIATPAVPVQASEHSTAVSEYELKRRKKMAANAKFLEQLGMTSAQLEMTRQLQQDQNHNARQRKKRAKPKRELEEVQPVRRSRRLRGETAPGSAPKVTVEESYESDGPSEFEVEASFAESSVLRYSVDGRNDTRKPPPSSSSLEIEHREFTGFQVDPKSYLYDHSLSKTYDIAFTHFHEQGLVAAGGHGGHVSIFPFSNSYHQPEIVDGFVDDPGAHIPLMSFKAHTGWVSAVSLARSIRGKANLLLTASNDASVKLWDLNHSSAMLQTPKEILTSTYLHQKGIFGMDVCGDAVVTCSKDATIALSHFRGDTGQLEIIRRFNDHHGVVKCVRFQQGNQHVFASGGNDRELRVFDARVAGDSKVVEIPDAHSRAINSVQFHPTDDNLLLSAGFDPNFYLHDLRSAASPVCTFYESPQAKQNAKAIFHPIFVRDGQGIVAARGHDLSLYRTCDGAAISRGYIDDAATCIAADPFHDRITIAQGGKLQFAEAKWSSKQT
ncbi:unnamed protein product [Phytophthora lilii]|uniref:Unnamed protein product n=1 Tax=Phytophthora lilii TaxID=2077276 RepID=A0A9W6WI02_9STRA|nr:unnamed protein product [Phytophthora lilii]